jgi:hypothetical protein
MTSNVAQSYPYRAESEAERAAAIVATLLAYPDATDRLNAASLPYAAAADETAWSWRCRTSGCPGVLHTAGYARDKHAIVALCDGCGLVALR